MILEFMKCYLQSARINRYSTRRRHMASALQVKLARYRITLNKWDKQCSTATSWIKSEHQMEDHNLENTRLSISTKPIPQKETAPWVQTSTMAELAPLQPRATRFSTLWINNKEKHQIATLITSRWWWQISSSIQRKTQQLVVLQVSDKMEIQTYQKPWHKPKYESRELQEVSAIRCNTMLRTSTVPTIACSTQALCRTTDNNPWIMASLDPM